MEWRQLRRGLQPLQEASECRPLNLPVRSRKVLFSRHLVAVGQQPQLETAGAGVDYKALPYLYVRGDFEYQDWFSFPPSGLSPSLLTVGVAYHFR